MRGCGGAVGDQEPLGSPWDEGPWGGRGGPGAIGVPVGRLPAWGPWGGPNAVGWGGGVPMGWLRPHPGCDNVGVADPTPPSAVPTPGCDPGP